MQRQIPVSGLGTFRKLLIGQYDLNLWAREKMGRPDDEVACKTQFTRHSYLVLKNLYFTDDIWSSEVLSKSLRRVY